MDDKKCTALLNLGITEKRNGNYEKALEYYEKAKEYNPQDPNIYYNSGKLLCGLGKYDSAIKNFLTYTHFTILKDDFSNPINLITMKNTVERIVGANFSLPDNHSFPSDWIEKLTNDDRLSIFLADINLTFYTGFSFLADNPSYLKFYLINDSMIIDLQNGLLGKPSSVSLKGPTYEIILITFGLILILENLKFDIPSNYSISSFYINKNFSIKNPLIQNKISFDDFLDRNPEETELDNFLIQAQKNIRKDLSIKSVFLGYNLLTDKIFNIPGMEDASAVKVGHTATWGFDREMLQDFINQKLLVYLCYIAIPIDDDNYLVEKKDMMDGQFEDYFSSKYNANIFKIGAISKGDHKKCRTFKFLYQKK
jgi:hypothetical protein